MAEGLTQSDFWAQSAGLEVIDPSVLDEAVTNDRVQESIANIRKSIAKIKGVLPGWPYAVTREDVITARNDGRLGITLPAFEDLSDLDIHKERCPKMESVADAIPSEIDMIKLVMKSLRSEELNPEDTKWILKWLPSYAFETSGIANDLVDEAYMLRAQKEILNSLSGALERRHWEVDVELEDNWTQFNTLLGERPDPADPEADGIMEALWKQYNPDHQESDNVTLTNIGQALQKENSLPKQQAQDRKEARVILLPTGHDKSPRLRDGAKSWEIYWEFQGRRAQEGTP
ncbi:hypothetical protein TREMEDRAFT_63669 [Tremella mesenterica DSM 1558]|uniref:uncharacterized protein n=1 Tax=Tremella mesenterica (strain ATCC 24925 / CBS 8224 / DSM 1558 / NBRC 9311 / NRRL Y-6157 / RJB 2259-6 / UBC 559-6) TaxID=578456 RepID=UPI0003F49FE9|nr:uncharacterized protein TREMEDRAFT_63669 [Tremella mesenterica DSM 1558]EIW68497.1 hypothetical protein TREMEDRAFT_63669 [Tremella mesenterica DSM 1558]